jgi:hypothetical protein
MKKILAAALGVVLVTASGVAVAHSQKARVDKGKIGLFEGSSFNLKDYDAKGARPQISLEFNVSSIAVYPGEKWQVCGGKRYQEPCMIIDKDTENLGGITVQSVRPVKE